MFEPLLARLIDRLSDSLLQGIAMLYGINERELRDAQRNNPSARRKLEKRVDQARHYEFELLKKPCMDAVHIQRLQSGRPSAISGRRSTIADLIHDMSFLSMINAPQTIELGKAMDCMIERHAEAMALRACVEAELSFITRIDELWDGKDRDELQAMRNGFDQIDADKKRGYKSDRFGET